MEKVTNRLALEFVLGLDQVKENVEVFDKLTKMLEQVEKKSKAGKSGKPTKAQEENFLLMETLVSALYRSENALQVKEIIALEEFEKMQLTSQKVSALMKKLVESGRVEKITEKRVSKFKVIKVDNDQE